MGNITELSRGSLNGLRRQLNECIENAYNKGYADGKKEPNEEHEEYIRNLINQAKQEGYDIGLDKGLEDASNLLAYADEKFIRECFPSESNWNLFDLNAKYGLAVVIKEFKQWQEQKKKAEEEIKVGDVVKFNENCHNYDHVKSREYLVLHIFDNGLATLLYDNGDTGAVDISLVDKTGRHIDVTEQLLDKLKGDK